MVLKLQITYLEVEVEVFEGDLAQALAVPVLCTYIYIRPAV